VHLVNAKAQKDAEHHDDVNDRYMVRSVKLTPQVHLMLYIAGETPL